MHRPTSLRVFDQTAALADAAADFLIETLTTAVAERGRCSLVLSGGSTPRPIYERLSARTAPWANVSIFWGDERLVPPADAGSNFGQARSLLLDHLPIPPQNIHRMAGELSPDAAVADYVAQLRAAAPGGQLWPRFDLVLLGLGADGHTASLFPGPIPDAELCSPVMAVTAEYEERPSQRITLTPPAFNAARQILFLVTGEKKAPAVAAVYEHNPFDPVQWPGQRIRPLPGTVTWFIDRAAASLLSNG